MTPPPMNLFGLIAAAIARVVIGMVWFTMFFPTWSGATGISKTAAQKGKRIAFVLDLAGSFLMAFVLLHAIFYAGARTIPLALAVAFVNWLGFVAVVQSASIAYEQKPPSLFGVYAGNHLVSMLAMGVILTLWGIRWA